MIQRTRRLVATFADVDALAEAQRRLSTVGVPDATIELQRGDDRMAATRADERAPRPTRPSELRVRAPRSIAAALLAGAVGAGIGVLVLRGVDIPGLPRWGDLVVFAVIGLLPASVYAFVMSGGGGPHPLRETAVEAEEHPLTLSVRIDPDDPAAPDADLLRRHLLGAGAVRVEPHLADRPAS